jgi:hypothetical protein
MNTVREATVRVMPPATEGRHLYAPRRSKEVAK